MDLISIRELKIPTIVGAHAWERHIQRSLLVDLDISTDIRKAAVSDHLPDALDYDAVVRLVTDWVQQRQAHLIETLAEGIASQILAHFRVNQVRVSVWKPGAVPSAAKVGVTIERVQDVSPDR